MLETLPAEESLLKDCVKLSAVLQKAKEASEIDPFVTKYKQVRRELEAFTDLREKIRRQIGEAITKGEKEIRFYPSELCTMEYRNDLHNCHLDLTSEHARDIFTSSKYAQGSDVVLVDLLQTKMGDQFHVYTTNWFGDFRVWVSWEYKREGCSVM